MSTERNVTGTVHTAHLGATESDTVTKTCPAHGDSRMYNGVCHGTHLLPQMPSKQDEDDDGLDMVTTVVTTMAIESMLDTTIDAPAIDTSMPTTDFGGFDGGSSGGGGADSSW